MVATTSVAVEFITTSLLVLIDSQRNFCCSAQVEVLSFQDPLLRCLRRFTDNSSALRMPARHSFVVSDKLLADGADRPTCGRKKGSQSSSGQWTPVHWTLNED